MQIPYAVQFPPVALVEQTLAASALDNVEACVGEALGQLPAYRRGRPGQTVAVAVGSRRIDRLDTVVAECLRHLKAWGLKPFIVPAMGSHGGATPEGQSAILAGYGITAESMRVPIRSDMETAVVSILGSGLPLHAARAALEADHLVLINRVKPHTKFKAPIESGICKMLSVGLGKHAGAAACHRYASRCGFGFIEEAAGVLLQKFDLLFGIGLVEDGYGRLAAIEAMTPETLIDSEKRLLGRAFEMLGRICLDAVDVLIVDYIGKEISGIGMDSNVTGRHRDLVGNFDLPPHPRRIFVRELSPASDGNANGIGLADVTTSRLVKRLSLEKTFVNAVTAISPEKAAIPMYFESDRQCLAVCIATAGVLVPEDARIVRIRSTAELRYIEASKAFEKEIAADDRLNRLTDWYPMPFDPSGNMTELPPDAIRRR